MKQNRIPEILCFCIFIFCTLFISFYHEPWLDEFQAWAISKETIHDILFIIPHYEGHPPLWHLILKCFSVFNINAEVGLAIANFLFIYPAVWLLIFKSPFSRIVRLTLPFTYFLCYQHAIISRPYSVYILGLFLAAIFYKKRNLKPFRFVLSLILLSLTSIYGMLISAGIVMCWFIEIIKNTKFSLKEFIKDRKIWAMALIFFVWLIISVTIAPKRNVTHMDQFSGYLSLKFLYAFFILPLDSLYTNICHSVPRFDTVNILWCFLTLLIYAALFKILKFYKSLLLFFIPFFMFLMFAFGIYVNIYHSGLITVFYIFVFWCIFNQNPPKPEGKTKKFYSFLLFIAIAIQIYWSIFAYIADYKYNYDVSRSAANYIKKYNLQDYKLMTAFKIKKNYVNKATGKLLPENIKISKEQESLFFQNYYLKTEVNYNLQMSCISIIPYFNKNIFYAFNINNPKRQYIVWEILPKEENEKIKKQIQRSGLPDIIFFPPQYLQELFPLEELKDKYYIKLNLLKGYYIWKNSLLPVNLVIYAREDIYNELKEKYPQIDMN